MIAFSLFTCRVTRVVTQINKTKNHSFFSSAFDFFLAVFSSQISPVYFTMRSHSPYYVKKLSVVDMEELDNYHREFQATAHQFERLEVYPHDTGEIVLDMVGMRESLIVQVRFLDGKLRCTVSYYYFHH